jgi:hypothetical protein
MGGGGPAVLRMIKAIETRYKGYMFRSRLEARWAVFFESCGFTWEYEPEGFECDGERYLPDFFVTAGESEWWCDIKPNTQLTATETRKMLAFSNAVNTSFWIISGSPWLGQYKLLAKDYQRDGKQYLAVGFKESSEAFTFCPMCYTIDVRSWYGHSNEEYLQCMRCDVIDRDHGRENEFVWFHKGWVMTRRLGIFVQHESLMNAYTVARSARFEHGETPRI